MENQQKEYGNIEGSARLSALIKALSLSQKQLAESIGVSRSLINLVVKAQRDLTEDIVYRIARKYENVNPHWLLTGEVEMLKPPVGDNEGALVEELRKENARPLSELRHTLELLEIRTKSDELHTNMLRDVLGKQKE